MILETIYWDVSLMENKVSFKIKFDKNEGLFAGLIINFRITWDIVPRYSSQIYTYLLLHIILILKASSSDGACLAWPSIVQLLS